MSSLTVARGGWARTIAFAAMLSIPMGMLPAGAVPPLFRFVGFVRDVLDRPLPGAEVRDEAGRLAVAGPDGSYSLAEYSLGQYTLTATRAGSVPQTRYASADLPVDQRVDFTLAYVIQGYLSRYAFTTAAAPGSATLTIETGAPNPGSPGTTGGASCVHVADSRTGTESSATYQTYDATRNLYVWSFSLEAPQLSPEATFTATFSVRDCATGTTLSPAGPYGLSYMIDNTPVALDDRLLVPSARGHTAFLNQILAATVADAGSGVDPQSVSMTLIDGQVELPVSASSTGTQGSLRVRSTPVSLMPNHVYRARLQVRDLAGNHAAFGWDFKTIDVAVGDSTARIPGVAGVHRGDNVWQFLPVLEVMSYGVAVGEVLHSGFGSVGQAANLAGASIRVNGVPLLYPYSSDEPVDVYSNLDRAVGETSPLERVRWQRVRLKPITVTLPAGVENPVLQLDLTTTQGTHGACMDPEVLDIGTMACSPDPIPFFLDEGLAQKIQAAKQRFQDLAGRSLPAQGAVGTMRRSSMLSGRKAWRPVSLDGHVVVVPWEDTVLWYLESVGYPSSRDLWPVHPSQYGEACAERFSCTYADGLSQDRMNKCVAGTGVDRWNAPDGECRQLIWYYDSGPSPSDDHVVSAGGYIVLEWGTHDAPKDEVGIAWDDGGSWQYLDQDASTADFALREEDVYTDCYGYSSDPAPVQRTTPRTGPGSVLPAIQPYGVNTEHTAQYGTEKTPADCSVSWGPTIWRTVGYMWNTHFHTVRDAVQGTAVFTYGHVLESTRYGWSIGLSAGVSSTGGISGVSFNFSVAPENSEKVQESEYAVGYCWGFSGCPT